MVYRIYVEKRPEYAVEARGILSEIRHLLRIKSVTGLRLLNRYDVEGISEELFSQCCGTVFSEPQLDFTYTAVPEGADAVFATEFLPGQFDQRAASAAECIQLISQGERPDVQSARVFLLYGAPSAEELAEIKKYVINPVEAREASLAEKATLKTDYAIPTTVETLEGFTALDAAGLADFVKRYGLAMDEGDIAFCQSYFKSEHRDPTITEIRMIDTYWSDHCRHTTFGTILDDVQIEDETVKAAWERYLALRREVHAGKNKPVCLMDLGTIGGKYLKKTGVLKNMDESDEINACSVRITVDNNGTDQPWLLLFKNETHNHPTEIEPFGGAATCLGGAIRDPLSGRAYIYQAMRVTGAGDPLTPFEQTIQGKLPQKKIVTTAAAGYSSYGNQIGLATGQVSEVYHPGYVAKRMEVGAVIGAVPADHVVREEPQPGDVIILLGGKTGRDGCGGNKGLSMKEKFEKIMADLNVCSQRGLSDRFDSTIGAGTVVMPYGGKTQLTPSQAMVAKIPVLHGETNTCSVMAWGFNPYISDENQFKGAQLAVIESVAKIIASGGSREKCWLSFQEYFEKIGADPVKWGKPFQSLLGGLKAQLELGCAAIGGKDSMSGSFEDIHVPPTLISFAVSTAKAQKVVTDEFKAAGDKVYYLAPEYDENGLPVYESVRAVFDKMESLIDAGKVKAVYTLGMKGLGEALCKMAFGNRIGFEASEQLHHVFKPVYGAFVIEADGELTGIPCIGETAADYTLTINGETIDLNDIQQRWEATLEPVYPRITKAPQIVVPTYNYEASEHAHAAAKIAQPRVLIPVFPGTNCEYDTARAFERAGAKADIVVIRNKNADQIRESVELVRGMIEKTQIIAIPGGFSGGDEPEGSAKFIVSFFRNPQITEAVMELLKNRDGLMCGICNGFQALVKLGLVPYGEIVETDASCPTLTYNLIGRHQSGLVRTRVASNKSPWLMQTKVGDIHTIAISHGEGRFVASSELVKKMAENGQIATQYVDLAGNPTEDYHFNPNGSVDAIEGITSPDGRVFGKMGHTERYTAGQFANVPGEKKQPIFDGAVSYFKD